MKRAPAGMRARIPDARGAAAVPAGARRPARAAAAQAPRRGRFAAAADSRDRLLQAGVDLARRSGLRALTVRGVAQQAGVNLGSFVYHFGTRDAFVAELIEHWYAPFYARLKLSLDEAEAPLPRLQRLLRQVAGFLIANREFIGHVLMDAAAGEAPARRFVASLADRHPLLVLRAVGDAQAAGVLRNDEPPLHLTLFLFAAVGAPVLAIGGALRGRLLPREVSAAVAPLALDRDAAYRRIAWALDGIRIDGRRS